MAKCYGSNEWGEAIVNIPNTNHQVISANVSNQHYLNHNDSDNG